MGILDRLNSARRHIWSPVTLDMINRGSDEVVRAGQPARVVVEVVGEDDGSVERIELMLQLELRDRSWPLAAVPTALGRHELDVVIPADLPPSSAATRYFFKGLLHRTKGMGSEARSSVFVIGDPAHAYRASDPQAGSDSAGLAIALDADVVPVGTSVSGRVTGRADRVEVGRLLDAPFTYEDGTTKQKQEFKTVGQATPDASGAFAVAVPQDAMPSLHDGESVTVTWEARAVAGKVTAWHRFVVIDPEGTTEMPEQVSSLARLLT